MSGTMKGDAKTDKERTSQAYGAGHTPLSYNSYLKVAELKNLQICQSDPPHHDEPLFIIIHQTYELWFKLILHELDEIMRFLNEDHARQATFLMRRILAVFRTLVPQIHILETMTPHDFLGFRNKLNPASGFQSSQFREIEFLAGFRDLRMLEHFKGDKEAYANLMKRFNEPGLSQVFYAFLKRRGFNIAETIDEDGSLSSEEAARLHDERIMELKRIYENPHTFPDLYDLSETLVEFDESISLWRTHHVNVVERIIGFKRGTGGSEGVGYLRQTLQRRSFPDLWNVRTVLEL